MNRVRIFIADDHDLIREGLRALLERHPSLQIVGEASSGREAVREVKKLRPDIVIMDIGLPELNGLDATRQLLRALPHLEVLIVTMHESEETVHKVLQAGARGYLVKTNATRHLVTAVESLSRHVPFLGSPVTQVLLDGYLNSNLRIELQNNAVTRFTEREREIIQLFSEGKRTKDVAAVLGISVRTTETHRNNILRKLNLHSTVDLVRYAIRNQIVQP